MTLTHQRHAYLPYVDGLRAIAVLAVVLYHLNPAWLPGGFAGVDIFFVISGFVVAASVGERERTSLPSFITYFISRRMLRIAPALIVCLLVTGLVAAVFIPDAWLSESNQRTGRYAFFGFGNLMLARYGNDYFSPISEYNPYTHTWSLGVEEQFYLLFPIMFWAWSFRGHWRGVVAGLFVAGGLWSFVHAMAMGPVDHAGAFYLLASRFWELAVGVLLYLGMSMAGRQFDTVDLARPRWLMPAAAVASIALLVSLITSEPTTFPAPGAVLPVLATAALLGLLHGRPIDFPFVRALTWHPMLRVGRLSYSLYLWHWPVFVLFRWTVGTGSLATRIAALAIAVILAVLSWRYVETTVRRAPRLKAMPRLAVVACGVLALYAGMWVSGWVDRRQPSISLSAVSRHAEDWYPSRKATVTSALGCSVTPKREPVGDSFRVVFEREACAGAATAPDVFVIGDSHAMAYGTMFSEYALDTGAKVVLYNNGGCPFLSLQPWREHTPHCLKVAGQALEHMLPRLGTGDVVFMPSLRVPRFVDQWDRLPQDGIPALVFGDAATKERDAAVRDGARVLQRIQATGARAMLEAPDLVMKAPLFRCADAWTTTNPVCADGTTVNRAEFERLRAPMLGSIQSLAGQAPGSHVWDPFPVLCPVGGECNGFLNGKPLFFDGDHLSGFANRLLLPSFTEAVRQLQNAAATPAATAATD
ncbi:MAG TPA: acyltransferase family protein [Luteibacter sp.]|uniref:acyltransferase family protein n=1 Tax=Luteibacter sp. TaxID=1886636 RepID=UPI002D0AA03C|nr:acyltransferase family protein [Luteibacter sp.]HVI53937.1 acyltransferase family protein [Luteibacter sp.]